MLRTSFVALANSLTIFLVVNALAAAETIPNTTALDRGLVAHWRLCGDSDDHSGNAHHAQLRGNVNLEAAGPRGIRATAAEFNGRDAFLEIPAARALQFGKQDFSIAAWVDTDAKLDDLPGDLLSQYDSKRRRGFHLSLKTNAGVATTQANYRNLQFAIDEDRVASWADCGRPGHAILAFALTVHDGELYAGTCEPDRGHTGRVYRYRSPDDWIDCGRPTAANAITAMAVCGGKLYAGTGKYRLSGSALAESENAALGGRIMCYDGGQAWTDCGQLPGVEAVGGLVVFRGQLFASALYKPAGFFRYDGGTNWTDCGTPGVRVEALGVFNGHLYATSYDQGRVFRFDGTSWEDCGQLGEGAVNTQTYSFAVYRGKLHVGTWRSGRVYRFEDLNRWTDVGRLGNELEVMGMLVHNGRLMAGTLPLAEVYAYQEDSNWQRLAQLDKTPDVTYRRAWTMAEFQGRVFCSTLPSGHVYASAIGRTTSWDREFPSGWHHVAAVRSGGQLKLFVDGRLVSASANEDAADFDLTSEAPLRIGFGNNDYFRGRLHDVRLYSRALGADDIRELAAARQDN